MADGKQQPGAADAVPSAGSAHSFEHTVTTKTVTRGASSGVPPVPPRGAGGLPPERPSVSAPNSLKDWKLWALIAFFLFLLVLVLVASYSSMMNDLEQVKTELTTAKVDLDKANASSAELSKKLKTTEGEMEEYKAVKPGATPEEIEAIVKKTVGNCRAAVPRVSISPVPASQAVLSVNRGPATGTIWYWRHNEATETNPGRCVFSAGKGEGKPPFCGVFSILPVNPGETKEAWIARASGETNVRVDLDQMTYTKRN
jgi:hypothetical protein